MKYSRPIVQLLLLGVCGSLGIWFIQAGYRWTPLVIVVVYLIAGPLIRRKLPPVTADPQQIQRLQLWLRSSYRFLGFSGVVGMSLCKLLLLVTRFKIGDAPRWATAIGLGVGWFSVWFYFRSAKWYEGRARSRQRSTRT